MISVSRKVSTLTQNASSFRYVLRASRYLCVTAVEPSSSTLEEAKKEKKNRHTKGEKSKAIVIPLNVHLAVQKMREAAWAKFDETVEVAVNLGVDPRKPNQSIKVCISAFSSLNCFVDELDVAPDNMYNFLKFM
jgi:hypothetical protein